MKIAKKYSHFAGEEYLIVHHKEIYNEIIRIIESTRCNIFELRKKLNKSFALKDWVERKGNTTTNDLTKNKIAITFHFNENPSTILDSFASHLLRYRISEIELGVEIIPTKGLQKNMSSGVSCFEKEVNNVLRNNRINLPVPLLIIGVEP